MQPSADLPSRLRALRHRDRLTVAEAAARASVSARQWHRWEHGEASPYYSSLEKIAAAFNVPAETLTGTPLSDVATHEDLVRLERKIDELREHLGL